jgi:hypothetical protein
MALNGTKLGTDIANAIMNSDAPADVKAACTLLWQKIATEITNHITENTEVPPGITVSTAGSPTAQTGATTAPGKVV